MSALLTLVGKDLRRRLRAPVHLALMLAFPIALLAIIGLAFRPDGGGAFPPIPVLLEDRDGGFLGSFLGSALQNEKMAKYFEVTPVDSGSGEAKIASSEAAALLVLPEGFTDAVLDGRPTSLLLVKNPGSRILPGIAESASELLALVLSAGARTLREPLDRIRSIMRAGSPPADASIAESSVLVNRAMKRAGGLLLPPAIRVERVRAAGEAEAEEGAGFNIFAYLFPGMVVLGLLFVAQVSMRDLMRERRGGQLRRLLASPTPMRAVIASKLLSTLLLLVLCHFLFAAVASVAFGVPVGDIPASLLLVVAQGLAVTGLLALLFALARTERQGEAISSVVILSFSLLGGSMVPLEQFPESMQAIGRFTPNYWTIDGFREVLLRGGTAANVAPHVAVLSLSGLAAALLASFFLGRSLREAA